MAVDLIATDAMFPDYRPGMDTDAYLRENNNYLFLLKESLNYTLHNLGVANFNARQLQTKQQMDQRRLPDSGFSHDAGCFPFRKTTGKSVKYMQFSVGFTEFLYPDIHTAPPLMFLNPADDCAKSGQKTFLK